MVMLKKEIIKNNVKVSHQTYASCVASFSILIAAFWTFYISPVLMKFARNKMPFTVTPMQSNWIVAIMDLGNFFSPIPAGYFMDRFGRKSTLIFGNVMYLLASLCAVFAVSGWYLFVARLLAGVGKGVSFTVSPIYVAEISSKNIRGALMSMFYAFFCCGVIVAAMVGPYVSFQTFNYISLAMPVLVITLLTSLPESMYYYVMENKLDAAAKALTWFRHTDTSHQQTITDGEMNDILLECQSKSKTKKNYYIRLFTGSVYRKALLLVTMVGLAQRFGGISYMLSYGTTDLPQSGGRFGREECFVVFSVLSLLANFLSGFLIDRIGRKPVLLFSTSITCIATMTGAAYFHGRTSPVDTEYYWIPYTVQMVFAVSFTAGLGVLPATFQGELFPPKVKRHASAMMVMALSLGSFTINLTHELVLNIAGVAGNYYVMACSSLFFTIWSYYYVLETKGKTLWQIQNELREYALTKDCSSNNLQSMEKAKGGIRAGVISDVQKSSIMESAGSDSEP